MNTENRFSFKQGEIQIELSGERDFIESQIKQFQALFVKLGSQRENLAPQKKKRAHLEQSGDEKATKVSRRGLITVSDKLKGLLEQGFFKEPKTAEEIHRQLHIVGFNIRRTSLPGYLLTMVRNGTLSREKRETKAGGSKYVYFQNQTALL